MRIRNTLARLFKLRFQEPFHLQLLYSKTVTEKTRKTHKAPNPFWFDVWRNLKSSRNKNCTTLHRYVDGICIDHQKFQFSPNKQDRQTFWDSKNNKWYPKSLFVLFHLFSLSHFLWYGVHAYSRCSVGLNGHTSHLKVLGWEWWNHK